MSVDAQSGSFVRFLLAQQVEGRVLPDDVEAGDQLAEFGVARVVVDGGLVLGEGVVGEAGQGTSHATYTWRTAGVQMLSVTATNAMGAVVSDMHTIEIEMGERTLYLPVIYRAAGP